MKDPSHFCIKREAAAWELGSVTAKTFSWSVIHHQRPKTTSRTSLNTLHAPRCTLHDSTMSSTTAEKVYHPRDAIASATKTTMLTGGVGLFASAVQNTLEKRNVGPWGVVTRSGGTIAIFGMACFYLGIAVDRI